MLKDINKKFSFCYPAIEHILLFLIILKLSFLCVSCFYFSSNNYCIITNKNVCIWRANVCDLSAMYRRTWVRRFTKPKWLYGSVIPVKKRFMRSWVMPFFTWLYYPVTLSLFEAFSFYDSKFQVWSPKKNFFYFTKRKGVRYC